MKHAFFSSLRKYLLLPAACLLLASGCAPVLLAGGGTGAIMANDERSTGSFVEDQSIELKITFQIREELGDQVNVSSTSYNRNVLLTGQTPTKNLHKHVLNIVRSIDNVRDIHDELVIANPSSLTSRASDAALTAKVKANLCGLQIDGFSCLDIKVVSEQGAVYLLGLVTQKQERIAVDTAKRTSGVLEVKTVFERAK